jgi:hypothetical protein
MKTARRILRLDRRCWIQASLILLVSLSGLYGVTAYVALPMLWRHYEHNPKLEHSPKVTQTAQGIPGDPLNVGLVGTKEQVIQAMLAAGWHPADPITFRTSFDIAASVLLKYPYPTAPVSNLYLFGRKQDLAFELPTGDSAKQRHHVRLWQSNQWAADGGFLWLGSATFDRGVELSHFTGQITHHIDADIDAERDGLMESLIKAGRLVGLYQVTGVGATLQGRNGEGDWYYTDGELTVGVLAIATPASPPMQLPNPAPVEIKNRTWAWVRRLLK